MAQSKKLLTAPIPKHRLLREILRHYTEFKTYVSNSGKSVIEHGYLVYDEDGEVIGKEMVTISFWDLQDSLATLSDRKREAVYLNVIRDMKQKDVAKEMGITTVSVGQYVEQAVLQIAAVYFPEEAEPHLYELAGPRIKDDEEFELGPRPRDKS